ncbi:phytoene/squalene synthase family protein [Picrophilus oshimae]|uniref:Phytoene synthase n=1 Tax=Picrophilus torridus (strain ATCC 700027 / DSM 9790 / JCM 10055 / NBRC 100828 / KAW 2/3) TaxID=1122961 RepID=A0A8G2L790_PICTO|nr:phytoene/squalene synthase family protein [Picrophilus oshimae]SMD30808.1 phytoene synthase [Picrophilus oshimae DSM 9789]
MFTSIDHNNSDLIVSEVFQKGSTTYFYSSRFFPLHIRLKVSRLYAFVRVADNFVDSVPQQVDKFYNFKNEYERALKRGFSDDIIINKFIDLKNDVGIDDSWVDAFLNAMESDINKKIYYTVPELLSYIYGSAEVIGLMMARILDLDNRSYPYARMLGRAMQYLNFIRDFSEDLSMGRIYLPLEFTEINDFSYENVIKNIEAFNLFIRKNLNVYFSWNKQAAKGFRYIKYRYLVPIKTASDMYLWTGKIIYRNPMVVYKSKVKPGKRLIRGRGIYNLIGALRWI